MAENAVEDVYTVVRNDEEQYSIWPAHRDVPSGWHRTDFQGPKDSCLGHIDEVWTDMRPLSLRRALAEAAGRQVAETPAVPEGPDLVTRLCDGEHRVRVVLRPEPSPGRLAEAVDDGYLHVLFPDTEGGTELGVSLDAEASDVSGADFTAGTGSVRLVGDLTLDFQPLRCTVAVDVAGLAGTGTLRPA